MPVANDLSIRMQAILLLAQMPHDLDVIRLIVKELGYQVENVLAAERPPQPPA